MEFRKLFHRRRKAQDPGSRPQPLRIEGIAPAPLTPEPDDAEQAAAALLELMASSVNVQVSNNDDDQHRHKDKPRDAVYYRQLAERIREAHRSAMLRTMRFLSFTEQELLKPDLPVQGPGSLALLETELYKRIDIIDRYGGELKRRWQHCLAEVTVRLMQAADETDKN